MERTLSKWAGAGVRVAFSTVLFLAPLSAQTSLLTDPPNVSVGGGSVATGSYSIGQIESVNAINGNMNLRIPAAHLPPGPGGFSTGVDLIYNSTIFDLKTQVPLDNTNVFQSEYVPSAHGGGWKYGYKYTLWSQTRVSVFNSATCNAINNNYIVANNWYKTILATPDGANRVLRLVGGLNSDGSAYTGPPLSTDTDQSYNIPDFAGYNNANCNISSSPFSGTLIYATADSTYIRVEANTVSRTWVAYFPDGMQVSGPIIVTAGHAVDSDATQIRDRKGNTIGITGNCNIGGACTETLLDGQGRTVTMSYTASSSNGWTDTITWPGPPDANGNPTTSTTNVNWLAASPYALPYYWRTMQTGTTYTGSGDTGYLGLGNWTAMVVSSVQLPPASTGNSINYIFNYGPLNPNDPNAYSWGEIHEVEMCTGAAPNNCQAQWKEQYSYRFDSLTGMPGSVSAQRPPGTLTNPIASKTFIYGETLQGVDTPLQETTSYYSTFSPNIYTYPATSGPGNVGSQITYPDGSYSLIYTTNLCPSNLKSRDLCVAVPFQTLNRDGSVTETNWVSNTLADGVPSGALFNPYVQYTVMRPPGAGAPVKIRFAQQDRNGNTTSSTEYDWAAASVVNHDQNTGVITSVCGQGTSCTALKTTIRTYWSAGTSYWTHGGPSYVRAPHTDTTGSATKTFTFDNAATTANLLYLDEYNSETGTNIRTSWTYLSNGNISNVTDPSLHSTAITHGCGANNDLYPATVAVAGTLNTSYTYDCGSGFLKSVQDTDNHITTSYTYDGMGRTKSVKERNTTTGLERTTNTTYDDLNLSVTTTLGQLSNTTNFDALGRVQSTVDGLGRRVERAYRYGTGGTSYELTSNPYVGTGESTMGWTLITRTVATPNSTTPDAVTVTGYAGATLPGVWGGSSPNSNATGTVTTTANVIVSGVSGCTVASTVKDAANNTRTNCVDGAGRLVAVMEPTGVLTSYTYDALDNLGGVNAQCLSGHTCSPAGAIGSPRTFTYSSLSRLQSASNPESGTTSYRYYDSGNLHTRTDANGSVATYAYDALDRPLTVAYSLGSGVNSTPTVTYSYDNNSVGSGFAGFVGAPSSISSTAGKVEYSYDGLGRIVGSRQTTPETGTPYTFGYEYSLTDQLTSVTYPSGRKVEYTLDAADQATRVDGTPPGGAKTAYASNITYTAAGDLSSLPFANGITEGHTWNSLLENTGISAGNLLSLGYAYCNNGAQQCATGNTGSPWQQTIAVGGQTMAVQSYLHDSLNRISLAAEKTGGTPFTPTCPDSGSVWCRQFGYDNGGNRSITARTPNGAYLWDVGTFSGNNRIADPNWSYDNNGNIIKTPAAQTIGYDAENRQVALCTQDPTSCPSQYASGRTVYVYDGLGNRVQRIDNTGTATFVYDAFGNLAAEYGTTAAPPGTQYVTVDALGSTRLLMTGTQASERHDFQPYGDEITGDTGTWRAGVTGYPNSFLSSLYAPGTMRQRFTGQERDADSGLDYFKARYFSGIQGRFTSPDPANAGAYLDDPQSWNGYGYVGGRPLAFTDPSGMFLEATAVGASTGNPVGVVAGALFDLGFALFGLFSGGGCHGDLSPVASTPIPVLFMSQFAPQGTQQNPCPLSARDRHFLDLYYKPVSQAAPNYDVDPALVLGLASESGFADPSLKRSTYNRTGDAFGQTGGSTKNMTTAKNPQANTEGWFANWGGQIKGAQKNVKVFIDGLEGVGPNGVRVPGTKVYNSVGGGIAWRKMATDGINQMLREVPIYLSKCLPK